MEFVFTCLPFFPILYNHLISKGGTGCGQLDYIIIFEDLTSLIMTILWVHISHRTTLFFWLYFLSESSNRSPTIVIPDLKSDNFEVKTIQISYRIDHDSPLNNIRDIDTSIKRLIETIQPNLQELVHTKTMQQFVLSGLIIDKIKYNHRLHHEFIKTRISIIRKEVNTLKAQICRRFTSLSSSFSY